jgi:hypothetical protein
MRHKIKVTSAEVVLDRILDALEQELIDASEEEIMQAAHELGMNPKMKGSAAFFGLKIPEHPRLEDFFEFELCKAAHLVAKRDTREK